MNFYFVLTLIFLSTFLLTITLLRIYSYKTNITRKRLKKYEYTSNLETCNNLVKKARLKEGKKSTVYSHLMQKVSRISDTDNRRVNRIRKKLLQAGYHNDNSIILFLTIRIISAPVFFFSYIYFASLKENPNTSIVFNAVLIGIVGYILPQIILNFKIRKRQEAIASGLGDALDLLVICVEAGLGLNAAILRVSQDIVLRSKELGEELHLVNQELRTGIAREKALRNLANRNRVQDIKILVGALVLADKLGTSIADTLRAQSDSLRTRIRQRAEEQAAKAGIKMLFPLALFILPALMIILMGPAFITLYHTLISPN